MEEEERTERQVIEKKEVDEITQEDLETRRP